MNAGLKNIRKAGKFLINGYLERDYEYLTKTRFEKSNNEKLRLNLVILAIDKNKMYGGLSTAMNFYMYLCQKLQCDMRILVTEIKVTEEILKQYPEFVLEDSEIDSGNKKVICNLQAEIRKKKAVSIRKNDIMITTYWTTHYIMADVVRYQKEIFGDGKKIIYLIQDFEPGFYQWSSEYLLCESTYKTGNTVAVFNSQNLKYFVECQGYKFEKSVYFEPKLNSTLLQYIDKTESVQRGKKIIIYGRPNIPRNCFSIIVEALKKYANEIDEAREWEYLSLGAKHGDIKLGNGCILKSCGKLSLEEYANVLAVSKIGISLMCSPHPSYPPLEMAAFGVKTITNSFLGKNLGEFSSNIVSLDIVNFETLFDTIKYVTLDQTENVSMDRGSKYLQIEDQFEDVWNEINCIFA